MDHFVRAFMAIRLDVLQGGVFHIVSPHNTRLSRVVDYARHFFGLPDLSIPCWDDFSRKSATGLEALFDKHMQVYTPYMQDTRSFEHTSTSTLLARQGIFCPDFSYEIFSRLQALLNRCRLGEKPAEETPLMPKYSSYGYQSIPAPEKRRLILRYFRPSPSHMIWPMHF